MGQRILWLTETYPPQRGGMAQSCDRLVAGLRSRGHTVDVLHFTPRKGTPAPVQQHQGDYWALPFEDSEAHTLNLAWTRIKSWQTWDAVVAFGGNLPIWGGPVFARWLGKPLLSCLRGNDFDTGLFTPRKREMLEIALKSSAAVAAVSSEKAWKAQQLFPEIRVEFLANGIDLNDWQPTPSETEYAQQWRAEHAPGKSVLGMVGQLKAKKGLAFFLETLRQIPVQDRMHLLLVGELPEEEQNLLSEVAVSYTHLPFLDRFELLKYYPCCDGVCIPSYYDGMPNVLLEAGALGIPVLASDVDGMHDVLHDVTPHLLFPVGDAHGLRKVLFDWLQADTATRQGWGQDLKTHIEQNYTVAHELDAYENLLASL